MLYWLYWCPPPPIVMLNLFNFVQFAHARHSSSKLVSALAQSQISASVRGEGLWFLVLGEILKQVQDDVLHRMTYGLLVTWQSDSDNAL